MTARDVRGPEKTTNSSSGRPAAAANSARIRLME